MGEYSCFKLKSFGPESNCKLKKMKIQILVLAFALVAVITAAPAKKAAAVDPDEKALDDAIAKNGPAIAKALKDVTVDDAMSDSDILDLILSNMNEADADEVANNMTAADTDDALSSMDEDEAASMMTSADAHEVANTMTAADTDDALSSMD